MILQTNSRNVLIVEQFFKGATTMSEEEFNPELVPEDEVPEGKCKVCVTKDVMKGKDVCESCNKQIDSAVKKAVEFTLGEDDNGNDH